MNCTSPFQLAICAEQLWLDKPIHWRASRLKELGFGVGLWWPTHDMDKLEKTAANFTIMNGYLPGGSLLDEEGIAYLLKSAQQVAQLGKRLQVDRLNLHGSGLSADGHVIQAVETITGAMWLKARDTLCRIAELGEREGVTFTLENLNAKVDHPGVPFARVQETLALVSSVNHPHLRLNLDLYHAQIDEGNLIETCRQCLPFIGEIQVADVPGRFEPGTGEVNWKNLAHALKDMGYAGPVGMEAWAKTDSDKAAEAFRAAFTLSGEA